MTHSRIAWFCAFFLLSGGKEAIADIEQVKKIPAGKREIYNAAEVKGSPVSVNLAEYGYVEEEYFVSGTASSFDYEDGSLVVHNKELPYVTRVVVRRPEDMATFSGILHVEPEHPSKGNTSHWVAMQHFILDSGDAYVSVGSGNDPRQRELTAQGEFPTAQSDIAKWYDPERYKALQWPEDDGIRYQVISDAVRYFRTAHNANPFNDALPEVAIAGGWSFTGSFWRTYVNYGFHEKFAISAEKPLFDGYLVGISSRWNGLGVLPLNSDIDKDGMDNPVRDLRPVNVPVIEFLTEFEVGEGDGPQVADSNKSPGAHRLYEIGAVIHGDQLLMDQGGDRFNRGQLIQLYRKGYPEEADALAECQYPLSDIPQGPYARAALSNLREWIVNDQLPPHAQELVLDENGKVLRDHHQNPLGGMPVAEFAVPLASYTTDAEPQCQRNGRPAMLRKNFSSQQLHTMYGNKDNYLKAYGDYLDAMVRERWVLESDAKMLKNKMADLATEAFAGKGE